MTDIALKEQILRLASDLTTLEINLIVKDDMTARKMPSARLALYEIAQGYQDLLHELAPERCPTTSDLLEDDAARDALAQRLIERAPDHALAETLAGERNPEVPHPSFIEAFALIQLEAETLLASAGDDEFRIRLRRIAGNAWQLVSMLGVIATVAARRPRLYTTPCHYQAILAHEGPAGGSTGTALELLPDEMVLVRKAWEIGTAGIAMQTVVQLDGDIVTYVARAHATSTAILSIHRDATEVALRTWKDLFQTIGILLGQVASVFRQVKEGK